MSSDPTPHPDRPGPQSGPKSLVVWLGMCVVCGLLIAPVFDAMPPRMKFIGLHSWALAACVAAACTWAALRQGIRSPWLIHGVSVCVALGALCLLSLWGFTELKQATARRVPMIPILQQVGSPEEMARSIEVQKQLAEAMIPTFTDFQRRRMNSPTLRKIRPLALWCGEMLIAAVVSLVTSRQILRQMKKSPDFDSLTPSSTGP